MTRSPKYKGDSGFTMIEIVVVIALIGVFTNIFSNILVSAMQIYVNHGERKTRHIDARRALEAMSHDLRELNSWTSSPTATTIDFQQTQTYQRSYFFSTYTYYTNLRTGYTVSAPALIHQRDESSDWANQYYLLEGDVVGGSSRFTRATLGGKDRLTIELYLSILGRPMRYRTTIFPRSQGG